MVWVVHVHHFTSKQLVNHSPISLYLNYALWVQKNPQNIIFTPSLIPIFNMMGNKRKKVGVYNSLGI